MIVFADKFFKKMNYSRVQLEKFLELAHKNLRIAAGADIAADNFFKEKFGRIL